AAVIEMAIGVVEEQSGLLLHELRERGARHIRRQARAAGEALDVGWLARAQLLEQDLVGRPAREHCQLLQAGGLPPAGASSARVGRRLCGALSTWPRRKSSTATPPRFTAVRVPAGTTSNFFL